MRALLVPTLSLAALWALSCGAPARDAMNLAPDASLSSRVMAVPGLVDPLQALPRFRLGWAGELDKLLVAAVVLVLFDIAWRNRYEATRRPLVEGRLLDKQMLEGRQA